MKPIARQTTSKKKPARTSTASAALKGRREFWQTTAPFDPEHALDSWEHRYAQGKALRAETPRESHADWTPAANRADPVATVLAGNAGRDERLIPLRMERMAASPFAFLRGACGVMAGDLAHTPISGPQVYIDGDAHINNFGLYGTPQRDVVIDINDFDEATVGPWEWDLKRLVTSANVAGRENGLTVAERRAAVRRCVAGYSLEAQQLKSRGILETWSTFTYAELERNEARLKAAGLKIDNQFRAVIGKLLKKAQRTDNAALLAQVAQRQKDGDWRFVADPPILTNLHQATRQKVIASLVEFAETLPAEFRAMLKRYSVADVCHRVVGVGSVGLRAYLVLLMGNGDDDPLFLQVKEAAAPAHAPYLPPVAFRIDHQGFRVIELQRCLQSLGDELLGYTTIDGRPYYVRQMKNLKASMPVELLTGKAFEYWGWVCGVLLARAHARNGDIAKIAGYIGTSDTFATALAGFAEAYGDQTERDYASFKQAVLSGHAQAVME
jgi:uncharacterized protein (DUF2252 family)